MVIVPIKVYQHEKCYVYIYIPTRTFNFGKPV